MSSHRLLERIRSVKQTLAIIDPLKREVLIANLMFLYDAVIATEELLREAAYQADQLPRSDFREDLVAYYRAHLEEERGHATWLRDDLETAGINMSAAVADGLAMAMIGTQYYLLKHVHPTALLGYMAVVEGDPVPLQVVDELERVHGKKLLRFIRIHAENDLEHRKELFDIIDRAPASACSHIADSADNALNYFVQAARRWSSSEQLTPSRGLSA